jgi:hypothetical protein
MDPGRSSGAGVWTRAADRFGIAHDLLATHVGRRHTVHTRAALALRDPVVNQAATARIVAALGDALAVGGRAVRALTRPPNGTQPGAGSRREVVWLSGALDPLVRLHRACTPRTLPAPGSGVLAAVDALTVATPRVARTGTPATVTDPVHALHLVQLLTFRQARGREPASAASLHDLTRLAARALTVTASTLPVPADPLGRVHRAAAVDQLATAHQSWAAAGAAVAAPVRTLIRAPALYRDTLTVLARALGSPAAADPADRAGRAGRAGGAVPEPDHALDDLVVDVATSRDLAVRVVTALPGLAADATTTWGRLTATGTVVTPVRDPGRHHAEWRPVPDRQAWLVRGTLEAAQVCSARAVTAVTTVLHAHAAAAGSGLGGAAALRATGPAAPNPSPGEPVAPGPVTPADRADRADRPGRPSIASVAGRPPSRRPGWPPPGKPSGPAPGSPSGPPAGPTPAGPSRPGRPPARPRPHPRFRADVPVGVAAGVVAGGGREQDGVRR